MEDKKIKIFKTIKLIIYFCFMLFLSAFNFRDVMVGSWNPQYIYNMNGQSIKDMAFADSLNGYICTWHPYNNDGSILITTNGGYNWVICYSSLDSGIFNGVQVINKDTCLVCRDYGILKTTNKGLNWSIKAGPYSDVGFYSFYAINIDTIWAGAGTGFNQPQLYLTTNGGLNWTLKFQLGSGSEFDRVYFYNKRIGFCCTASNTYKTTNGGDNWYQIISQPFGKLKFTDSLIGWTCFNYTLNKTTDGGYSWTPLPLPSNYQIINPRMMDFSIVNKDTIWGCGSAITYFPPPSYRWRGIIWKTTNGGQNWGYQLPDTGLIRFGSYDNIFFLNKIVGWVYRGDSNSYTRMGGIHTTTGGLDSTIYVGIKENTLNFTKGFILYQNYPNPFNPVTNIKYKITSIVNRESSIVRLIVYDIQGKETAVLVNEKQKAGEYEVKFNGSGLSSGVYFYSLFLNGQRIDTKKLILLK